MADINFDEKRMARLDNPKRRKLLPREIILPLLDVREDDTVLDVGSGAGYFTFPIAELTKQSVYALDIEDAMLNYIQNQIETKGTKNITLLKEPIEKTSLKAHNVDRVIASMVLHEVKPLDHALGEIYRVLKPGGRFVVIEWKPDLNDKRANRIKSQDMQEKAEQAGFEYHSLTFPSKEVYAVTFNKPKQ